MIKIRSIIVGGMVGAFALASGATLAFAQTVAREPVLLAAPAQAFPAKSEANGDSAKNDPTVDTMSVAQSVVLAERVVTQGPPNEVAPVRPVAPTAFEKARPKSTGHLQKRADRVAFNESNFTTLSRPHSRMLMIGVSY
jgi:hypothetical protein